MKTEDISVLNDLLKAEQTAVDAYRNYIEQPLDKDLKHKLAPVMASHERRVDFLEATIVDHGGVPVSGSVPRGAVAATLGQTAALLDSDTVVNALQWAERKGSEVYLDKMGKVSEDTRFLLERTVVPEQSHAAASVEALAS
ncbi:MAG: DUF2383 domain-containing protein [Myxococcota bacterium]